MHYAPLTDPIKIQAEAARVLGEYLGASRVHYGEIVDEGTEAVIHSDFTNGVASIVGTHDLTAHELWPAAALRLGQTSVSTDVANEPNINNSGRQAMLALSIEAFVSVPLVKDGVWIGLLSVQQSRPRQWTWSAVERAYVEEALRSSEAQMRSILESVQDYAIFTLDELGRVTSWNEGARRLTGYTAEEIIGKSISIFYTPDDVQARKPDQEMATALETGRSEDESWRVRKDGSHFWANEIMTPLRRESGNLFGFTKISRDLSERRRVQERLEAEVLERTSQVRSLVTQLTISEQEERRRVSTILHDDLQQRLFGIIFQLSFLSDAFHNTEAKTVDDLMTEINAAIQETVQITRDLSIDLSPPVLHNEGLLEAVQWLATQMKNRHGLEVEVRSTEALPATNEDLRVLLFQLVRELLFNVVKHAGVRQAMVTLGFAEGVLRIDVSDEGKGFEVPKQGENRRNSQGLSRIEQRLQLFGGRVEIDSTPGHGTRVTLVSPAKGRENRNS